MKVTILVPPRPEFSNAYWFCGKRYTSGQHTVELTEAQYARLQLNPDPVIALMVEGQLPSKAVVATDEVKTPGKIPPPEEGPGRPLNRR